MKKIAILFSIIFITIGIAGISTHQAKPINRILLPVTIPSTSMVKDPTTPDQSSETPVESPTPTKTDIATNPDTTSTPNTNNTPVVAVAKPVPADMPEWMVSIYNEYPDAMFITKGQAMPVGYEPMTFDTRGNTIVVPIPSQ